MGQKESKGSECLSRNSTKDNSLDEKFQIIKSLSKSKTIRQSLFKKQIEKIDKFSSEKCLRFRNLEINEKDSQFSPSINKLNTKVGSLYYDIRDIYSFQEVIGSGFYGKVRVAYKKVHPDKLYAIKSIKKSKLTEKDLMKLFREVDILSSLNHQNIIKFHETYQDSQYFHIVMDLCSGKELLELIEKGGHLSEDKVCKIVFKVLSSISYCHKMNIVHRDLKPENIVFVDNSIDSDIRLIDFGLSCRFKEGCKLKSILGTPYYIAPEILKGSYDEKCDIWSIGAITFLMLTGHPPFQGDSTINIFKSIVNKTINFSLYENFFSEDALDFLKMCLRKDPKNRLTSQEALKHKWFTSIRNEIHSPTNINPDVLKNVGKNIEKNEFKRLVIKHIVKNMNEFDMKPFKDTFRALDIECEGFIYLNALREGYRKVNIEINEEELTKIFESIDYDKDGKIDFIDFLSVSFDTKIIFQKEAFKNAFDYFDFDHSGYIDHSDLEKVLLSTGCEILNKTILFNIIRDSNCKNNTISSEDFLEIFGY
jgi:calcium-dependent protein kinase